MCDRYQTTSDSAQKHKTRAITNNAGAFRRQPKNALATLTRILITIDRHGVGFTPLVAQAPL